MFERLAVGIGVHPAKAPMFTDAERVAMLKEELNSIGAGDQAEVLLFQGLAVNAARVFGAQCIVRGLRDGGDFNYEMQMSGMNAQMAPDIETVFVAASPGTAHIAGTLVRQIASLGGDVSSFVSPTVLCHIKRKFQVS
jgi:pantetheine-phosphate adenylyltransferase